MLKTFLQASQGGASSEFWEAGWAATSVHEALRFCDHDPLATLFTRFFPVGGLVLEGGCGLGHYVEYYERRGVRMVGLDFTTNALLNHKSAFPHARLCQGDVASLPFADESFDAYYSGGVVEHFEKGPEIALAEARRVLKSDGVLIISVPYLNVVRRVRHLIRRLVAPGTPNRQLRKSESEVAPDEWVFFQYVYSKFEFQRLLEGAGFKVLETRGTHVLWGLREIGVIDRLIARMGKRSAVAPHRESDGCESFPSAVTTAAQSGEGLGEGGLKAYLKRAFLDEDDRALPLLPAIRPLAANMMVYVCKPTQRLG